MRDITHKFSTLRIAQAKGRLRVKPETLALLRDGKLPKGDPLPVARVAGIQAAKNTSLLIPYCHPIPIDFVEVGFALLEDTIEVTTTVKAIHKTGVEMEALTSASVAALTLYDMMKIVDDTMEILDLRLVSKSGGKSDFVNEFATRPRAAVLVMSDSVAGGQNQDQSGKMIADRLATAGIDVADYRVIPDDQDQIEKCLIDYADQQKLSLVITSGGTGLSPRDRTPEATAKVINRQVPGIVEAARAYGQERIPYSMLSRAVSGLRGDTLIINIPGSRKSTAEYLDVLFPAVLHALKIIGGASHGGWNKTEHP